MFFLTVFILIYKNFEPLLYPATALLTVFEAFLVFLAFQFGVRTNLIAVLYPFQIYFYYKALNLYLTQTLQKIYFSIQKAKTFQISQVNRNFFLYQGLSIVHLNQFNQIFSSLYIILFLFFITFSIYFTSRFMNLVDFAELLISLVFSVIFVFDLFILMFPFSKLSSSIHKIHKPLFRIQQNLRREHLRDKLQFDSLLNRLLYGQKYGFTYGQYATFTSATFLQILSFYKGIIIIVMKIEDYNLYRYKVNLVK